VFQGTACDKMLRFVKHHRVVLPYTLCVECAISQKGNTNKDYKAPKQLIEKFLVIVKNGAYVGKSPARIVEEERTKNAAIESLIDEEEKQIMVQGELDNAPDFERVRAECNKSYKSIVDFVREWADKYYKNICKKGLEKEFRIEDDEGDLVGRFGKWLQVVDTTKRDILKNFMGNKSNTLSSDRWEWQMLRLSIALGIELASKRNKSGPDFENRDISNDIFDIQYVSYLLHADGLITCDKKLVQPLAIAAFPNKDVFGSIDDVPSEY
jgi:hypothetical protein